MVNICGKCKHFIRTETDHDGNYYHYCNKADEIFPPTIEYDSVELHQEDMEIPVENFVPTLKVKFNDSACQYYEKNRRK